MRRPCLVAGCPNTTEGSRCPEHAKRKRDVRPPSERGLGWDHAKMAKRVLAEEKICWLCGKPGYVDDPLQADHVIPRSKGGTNVRSNYHAAHASCNRSRGNRDVHDPHPVNPEPPRYAV
jgi:5-methylcytosine-specific restriction endonuclease McrA